MKKIKKYCIVCNKQIFIYKAHEKWGKGKYCSVKCRAKHKSKKIPIACKCCGKIFKALPSRIKTGKKYCSEECQHKAQKGFNGTHRKNGRAVFKRHSKENRGSYCPFCKTTKNIEMHHIDGNKYNNQGPENYITVCRSCHMRIHGLNRTFKYPLEACLKIFIKYSLYSMLYNELRKFKYHIKQKNIILEH